MLLQRLKRRKGGGVDFWADENINNPRYKITKLDPQSSYALKKVKILGNLLNSSILISQRLK
jgi:hypothetical protein